MSDQNSKKIEELCEILNDLHLSSEGIKSFVEILRSHHIFGDTDILHVLESLDQSSKETCCHDFKEILYEGNFGETCVEYVCSKCGKKK